MSEYFLQTLHNSTMRVSPYNLCPHDSLRLLYRATFFCFQTVNCGDGEIRLVAGQNKWEGRLEMCYNRRWSTVGADGWTQTNSDVVCNSLGYGTTGKDHICYNY